MFIFTRRQSLRRCAGLAMVILKVGVGCGTYSTLRPADNLKSGEFEFQGAASLGSIAKSDDSGYESTFQLPILQGGFGITDWWEVDAQLEIPSQSVLSRFAVLNSETHGVALALGLGGGNVGVYTGPFYQGSYSTKNQDDLKITKTQGTYFYQASLGRQWNFDEAVINRVDVYLTGRNYHQVSNSHPFIQSLTYGIRMYPKDNTFIGLERQSVNHNYEPMNRWAHNIVVSLGITFGGE